MQEFESNLVRFGVWALGKHAKEVRGLFFTFIENMLSRVMMGLARGDYEGYVVAKK